MDIILLEPVAKLGERGDTVKVKSGYARNFLFPRSLALPASTANSRVFKERGRVLDKQDELAKLSAQRLASKMAEVSCTINVQVGEEDQLYGSVTAADIAKSLESQGHEIDRKQVLLDEPIKQLGVYTVEISLHRQVTAPIKVWVVKD